MTSAPELYAISQEPKYKPEGHFKCHWCGDPCGDKLRHDDPQPQPFSKVRTTAMHPGQAWQCKGCWLFRRTRTTVHFTSGPASSSGIIENRFKDGQCPMSHSWLITQEFATALERLLPSEPFLYGASVIGQLLQPPKRFTLMLLNGGGVKNLIHKAACNDHDVVKANTPLLFTIDNVVHEYTIYDLEQALESKEVHVGPGVRALMKMLGISVIEEGLEPEEPEKLERGRPLKTNWDGTGGKVKRKVTS